MRGLWPHHRADGRVVHMPALRRTGQIEKGDDMTTKPWTIEQNPSGFLYVVDHDGKKICTVYGDSETRLQRAIAIADIPVMQATLRDVQSYLQKKVTT